MVLMVQITKCVVFLAITTAIVAISLGLSCYIVLVFISCMREYTMALFYCCDFNTSFMVLANHQEEE